MHNDPTFPCYPWINRVFGDNSFKAEACERFMSDAVALLCGGWGETPWCGASVSTRCAIYNLLRNANEVSGKVVGGRYQEPVQTAASTKISVSSSRGESYDPKDLAAVAPNNAPSSNITAVRAFGLHVSRTHVSPE